MTKLNQISILLLKIILALSYWMILFPYKYNMDGVIKYLLLSATIIVFVTFKMTNKIDFKMFILFNKWFQLNVIFLLIPLWNLSDIFGWISGFGQMRVNYTGYEIYFLKFYADTFVNTISIGLLNFLLFLYLIIWHRKNKYFRYIAPRFGILLVLFAFAIYIENYINVIFLK